MSDIVERLRATVGHIGVRDASEYDARARCSDLIEAADEIDRLHSIVALGVEMRAAQARYFKDRSRDNLIASKQAEAAFDKAARDHIAGAGKKEGA